MRAYRRRGPLVGERQKRVARASPFPGAVGVSPTTKAPFSWPGEGGQVVDSTRRGDEVEQLVDLTSTRWKSPLGRRLRFRIATWPVQSSQV